MLTYIISPQSRGSPHLHCLLWCENAPEDPLTNTEEAAKFIDELISCSSTAPHADKNKHHHTATCFKSRAVLQRFWNKELTEQDKHHHCRFGAPFFPSPRTRILLPLYHSGEEHLVLEGGKSWKQHGQELGALRVAVTGKQQAPSQRDGEEESEWEAYLRELRQLRHRLKDVLVSDSCPDTLEELWRQAGCPDEESYLLAIRAGIKRPMVLYRRKMEDRWTNPYLPWVLEVFGSNCDAQLILDVYSLVR